MRAFYWLRCLLTVVSNQYSALIESQSLSLSPRTKFGDQQYIGRVGNCVPDTNVLTTQGRDRCDVLNSDLTQNETQHKCEEAQLIDEKQEREEPTPRQRKTEGGGLKKSHERKEQHSNRAPVKEYRRWHQPVRCRTTELDRGNSRPNEETRKERMRMAAVLAERCEGRGRTKTPSSTSGCIDTRSKAGTVGTHTRA